MSTFNLNSIPGVQGVSKTVSGLENLSSNVLNREPAKTEQNVGLLSRFGVATSKGSSTVLDRLLDIIFSILSFWFSILRKITPPFIRNFLIFFIPPILAFYELAFRVYFRRFRLPSLFTIAFKLHKRGYFTIGTVIWLASSLPGDILGGLVALGGVAAHATEAVVGGVSSVGHALSGTATHIVGDTANTLSHLGDGLHHAIPTGALFPHVGQSQDAIQGAVNNANAITGTIIGSTQGAATELVHALDPLHLISKGSQDSQKQPVSGERAIPAVIQQAANPLAAATENVTKVANALENINPLHLNLAPKGSQASQVPVRRPSGASIVYGTNTRLGSWGTQPNPIGSLLHPKIPGLRS